MALVSWHLRAKIHTFGVSKRAWCCHLTPGSRPNPHENTVPALFADLFSMLADTCRLDAGIKNGLLKSPFAKEFIALHCLCKSLKIKAALTVSERPLITAITAYASNAIASDLSDGYPVINWRCQTPRAVAQPPAKHPQRNLPSPQSQLLPGVPARTSHPRSFQLDATNTTVPAVHPWQPVLP